MGESFWTTNFALLANESLCTKFWTFNHKLWTKWDVTYCMCFSPSPQHGKNGIFCISWSHKDSKRIATCSGDGFWQVLTVALRFRRSWGHSVLVSYKSPVILATVSSGPSMAKSSISTNILLLCLGVTGARTTSKRGFYLPLSPSERTSSRTGVGRCHWVLRAGLGDEAACSFNLVSIFFTLKTFNQWPHHKPLFSWHTQINLMHHSRGSMVSTTFVHVCSCADDELPACSQCEQAVLFNELLLIISKSGPSTGNRTRVLRSWHCVPVCQWMDLKALPLVYKVLHGSRPKVIDWSAVCEETSGPLRSNGSSQKEAALEFLKRTPWQLQISSNFYIL